VLGCIVPRAAKPVIRPDINSEAMDNLVRAVTRKRKMLQEQVISTRKDVGMVSVADYQAGLESSKAKNAKQNDAELN